MKLIEHTNAGLILGRMDDKYRPVYDGTMDSSGMLMIVFGWWSIRETVEHDIENSII
jgi:hypothetical protein